jgi:hypothetical protein
MPRTKQTPTLEEKIRARAHEIWVGEGRPEGQHLAHWRQAEAEIAERAQSTDRAQRTERRPSIAPAARSRRKAAAE